SSSARHPVRYMLAAMTTVFIKVINIFMMHPLFIVLLSHARIVRTVLPDERMCASDGFDITFLNI
ncbi:MAG: hypothetical protein VX589_18205, partial [Myxococcota bacterium]|nr:hypothetical protein [Myxococcota bacterium]